MGVGHHLLLIGWMRRGDWGEDAGEGGILGSTQSRRAFLGIDMVFWGPRLDQDIFDTESRVSSVLSLLRSK